MNELTITEIYEAMRESGKDPNNWIHFCAFVARNYIMIIDGETV